ncbi:MULTISPECIES: NAD(P)-binding domain-containing protein [unclassified Pseudomonas]|uniref:NAD(P)-binding domain-containing protein n=1 Tax=unclassified Pseudomonas TaxID=196821 RepID=UPI002113F89A|nr:MULTISPECIES: NAD(P)-binding domain-containing protein [unclassified Pseudomonas]
MTRFLAGLVTNHFAGSWHRLSAAEPSKDPSAAASSGQFGISCKVLVGAKSAANSHSLERILGGGANDQLEERGKLGLKTRQLLNGGVIELFKNIAIDQVVGNGQGLVVKAGGQILPPVDPIIVATGFRPGRSLLAELRIALDPATQSVPRRFAAKASAHQPDPPSMTGAA